AHAGALAPSRRRQARAGAHPQRFRRGGWTRADRGHGERPAGGRFDRGARGPAPVHGWRRADRLRVADGVGPERRTAPLGTPSQGPLDHGPERAIDQNRLTSGHSETSSTISCSSVFIALVLLLDVLVLAAKPKPSSRRR